MVRALFVIPFLHDFKTLYKPTSADSCYTAARDERNRALGESEAVPLCSSVRTHRWCRKRQNRRLSGDGKEAVGRHFYFHSRSVRSEGDTLTQFGYFFLLSQLCLNRLRNANANTDLENNL